MIYIADNLAYFPYQQQDEPLFIMHQLDIIVSVSGSNLLQSFKEVCVLYLFSTSTPSTPAVPNFCCLKGSGCHTERRFALSFLREPHSC